MSKGTLETQHLNTKRLITMTNKAQGSLDKFVDSVGELLNDISALEVNTMIVEKITAAKFNALEAYQLIYSISDSDYFNVRRIPENSNLRKRYKNLFESLERDYFYLLCNSSSELFNKDYAKEKRQRYKERIQYLKEQKEQVIEASPKYISLGRPILPDPTYLDPTEGEELQVLLNNNQFLRSLRKINELKAALDSSDPTQNGIDVIYAQTVMQLDGDIINRYHMKLFEREDIKDLVLETHKGAVVSGEKQWRGLLDFMVDLVTSVTSRRPFS